MSPEKGQFQKEIINIVVKFSNHHFSGGFGCQFSGVFFFGQLKNRPRGPSNRIYQHICTSERREESIGCSAVFFWEPKKNMTATEVANLKSRLGGCVSIFLNIFHAYLGNMI